MSSGTGNLHQTTLKSKATSMESITTSIQAANGRTHHRRSGATWTSRASPKLSRSRYGRSYLSLRPATKAFQIVTDRPTKRAPSISSDKRWTPRCAERDVASLHCSESHQQQPSTAARPPTPVESPALPSPAPEAPKGVEKPVEIVTVSSGPSPPKKTNRCTSCNKRVGLLGFSCRCGGLFCSQHRYEKEHDCGFDYKSLEREWIAKANPVVQADKIQHI
ncbi:hypothetical protein QR680_007084 [Steinernema hermaphroditum]|uniref:AN1-type domain-containing protein n=1 Tax=Steinernema hermaphroditum TaxID=289476 RepID=A0AA39HZ37_9BILA|nr:hypothetical protein QR680_007084 [Steinernema hermaphroditum]